MSQRVSVVKRSQGQTAPGSLSYVFGENMKDERIGKIHYCAYKSHEVVFKDILLSEHAPAFLKDAATFAHVIEQRESMNNAQLLRRVFCALPRELDREQHIALVRDLAQTAFVSKGMCCALAIHDKSDGNPHAHFLLTLREMEPDGTFGKKVREWNRRVLLKEWMLSYQNITNSHLERAGSAARICVLSYKDQGIDREPTLHLGHYAHQLELRGIPSEIGDLNREIQAENARRVAVSARLSVLEEARHLEVVRLHGLHTLEELQARLEAAAGTLFTQAGQLAPYKREARRVIVASVPPKNAPPQEIPSSIKQGIGDVLQQEEEFPTHVVSQGRKRALHHTVHHERMELELSRAQSYAEEEWDRSPARRRYDEGHWRTPGKCAPRHQPVRATLEKSSGQGNRPLRDLYREDVGYEPLLDTPSPRVSPACDHLRPPARRVPGHQMQHGGP